MWFLFILFILKILSEVFGLAQSVVEGVFEAGEFAEEGVVAGVGIPGGLGKQAIEGALRFQGGGIPAKDSSACEAWGGDFYEAGFDGEAGAGAIGEPLADESFPRKPGEEVIFGDGG